MPPAPLTSFADGADLVVNAVDGGAEHRLRDVGLREGAVIAVLQNTGNLIIRVAGCRIGLRREMAARILATPAQP